ncbi:MAG: Fur family transcriptional regulator [Spirochaetales bacterium]|nr:Fur family transcriptional regulator [Spirochaetales bacterium]
MSEKMDDFHGMRPCCRRLEGGIKNRGMRMTIPRQLVAEVLEQSDKYLGAEEIYSIIRENYPAIGLATVYRTLVLMDELGLVTRQNFGEGRSLYIAADNQNDRYHHQLICDNCYKVIRYSELSDDDIELYRQLEERLSARYGFEINKQVVQIHGICPECKKKLS